MGDGRRATACAAGWIEISALWVAEGQTAFTFTSLRFNVPVPMAAAETWVNEKMLLLGW